MLNNCSLNVAQMEMIVDEKAAGKQLRPLYLIKPLIAS